MPTHHPHEMLVWCVQIDEHEGSPIESVVVGEGGQETVLDPDRVDPYPLPVDPVTIFNYIIAVTCKAYWIFPLQLEGQ